jgi:photosystem II stability/assembly factor-like uncharacterized protein
MKVLSRVVLALLALASISVAAAQQPPFRQAEEDLPPRYATMVAVDASTPTKAYISFSGFTGFGDSLGHVFLTTNGGTSWRDISGNLPNSPVNAVVVNPNNSGEVFVGTDTGVFMTRNGGTTWLPLASGLPKVAVLGLTYHATSGTLWASTHGRGVWDIHVQ